MFIALNCLGGCIHIIIIFIYLSKMSQNCAPFVGQFGIQNLIISDSFKFFAPLFVRLPMTWSGWWGAGKRLAVTSGRSTEERPLTPKKSPCQRRVTCVTCREEVRSDDFFWNRMAFMYCLQQVSFTTHYNELASIQSPAGCRLCRPYRGDRCCGSVQVQSVAL